MVVKVKEYFEKRKLVKNNDKSMKYILRGQRNTRYHERILSNTKKVLLKGQIHFHLINLEPLPEHLIELEHLPEHLVGELFGARTMT